MSLTVLEEKRQQAFANLEESWDYLNFLEINNIHKPRDVVQLGMKLLKAKKTSETNKWRLMEKIAICSLELGQKDIASKMVKFLIDKFGQDSKRVKMLRAMELESDDQTDKAIKLYDSILAQDSNHMGAWKRSIGIMLTTKDHRSAIKSINEYLEFYPNDKEAWKLLLNLYLIQHNYEFAKFVCEELILINGDDYLYLMLYAEILYNIGNQNNLLIALKYFSQCILLSSNLNLRCLFGILMCLRALNEINVSNSNNDDNSQSNLNNISSLNKELIQQSCQKIMKCYTKFKSPLLENIKAVLLEFDFQN